MTEREYAALSLPERPELREALEQDDALALQSMVLSVAMYDHDEELAQDLSAALARHEDEFVRGNAVLGLGHVARRFGALRPEVIELINAALHDPSDYVRGQAHAAADDASHFLGVQFSTNLSE